MYMYNVQIICISQINMYSFNWAESMRHERSNACDMHWLWTSVGPKSESMFTETHRIIGGLNNQIRC